MTTQPDALLSEVKIAECRARFIGAGWHPHIVNSLCDMAQAYRQSLRQREDGREAAVRQVMKTVFPGSDKNATYAQVEKEVVRVLDMLAEQASPPTTRAGLLEVAEQTEALLVQAIRRLRDFQGGGAFADYYQKQLDEIRTAAAKLPETREGWVMVPREPTEAMQEAGGDEHWQVDKSGNMRRAEAAHRIYRAMLAAATKGTK